MNALVKSILDEIVNPAIRESNNTYIADVISYDSGAKTIDIALDKSMNKRIDKVRLPTSIKSVIGKDPQAGDRIVVCFAGGSFEHPYIVSMIAKDESVVTDDNTGKDQQPAGQTQTQTQPAPQAVNISQLNLAELNILPRQKSIQEIIRETSPSPNIHQIMSGGI